MAQPISVGIIGGGWPGRAHARGYTLAGGYRVEAVADLIPERREQLAEEFKIARQYSTWEEMIDDQATSVVSVCLPNAMHYEVVIAALRAGKHVICETPPTMTATEARRIESSADKNGKQVLYAFQRRFGGNEQAAYQAIAKGYAGSVYHARATWTRTRAVPLGTGWYTQREQSGGGALADLGSAMLDLGWHLLGQPEPQSVMAITHRKLSGLVPEGTLFDVEEMGSALIRFADGRSLELAASWAINQSPAQNGVVCRVHGDAGAVEVYTAKGSVMHRGFGKKNESKETPLKLPKVTGHAAMMRHFKDCIQGKTTPICGPRQGVTLMQMIEAIYKSAEAGKSVQL